MDERDYTALAADYDRTRFDSPLASFLLEREVAVIRQVSRVPRRVTPPPAGRGVAAPGNSRIVSPTSSTAWSALMSPVRCSSAPASEGALLDVPAPGWWRRRCARYPIRGASCDVVLSTRFLHLFPRTDHRRLLERLLHPLRAGGLLVVEHDSPLGHWRQWLGVALHGAASRDQLPSG